MEGYVKSYRKMMNSTIWHDPFYLKLWMYCLYKASHKEREVLIGNQLIKLQMGEFVTGRTSLAEDLNKDMKPSYKQSEITWWRYLNNLEKLEMLNIKKTNKYSVVSIINWCLYQETEQQMNNKRTTDEQQMNTNKNVNNSKNGNKKDSCPKYEICDMESAKLLFSLMQQNNPDVKEPNFDKWADDIRKLRKIDNRPTEKINKMIHWTQQDSFWCTNILSPDKLRKQWNQLALKANSEYKTKKQKKDEINWEEM